MNAKTLSGKISKGQKQTAQKIEGVFETFYKGKSAYSTGEFYQNEFFLRTDYALVVLSNNDEILVSFADHTKPSYAALITMLLDGIEDINLYICEDYETDKYGSMVCDEEVGSTGQIIWDDKVRYYNMLKQKVGKIVIRKTKTTHPS